MINWFNMGNININNIDFQELSMKFKQNWPLLTSLIIAILTTGCVSQIPLNKSTIGDADVNQKKEDITYGAIKRSLKIGTSNQADVIKRFGSPNNMTYQGKGRGELWIYDRIHTESMTQTEATSAGIAVGGVGGVGGGAIGASVGSSSNRSATRATSSVRMLTVILEFDGNGTLIDISARQGGY